MVSVWRMLALLALAGVLCAAGMSLLCLVGRVPADTQPPPPPLTAAREAALSAELRAHVEILAGQVGDRNYIFHKNLTAAAAYIERQLAAAGYAVSWQEYAVGGKTYRNLIAERRGSLRPATVIVVGSHYDCAVGSPGADDNASGVAALLALARAFARRVPACTVRFAFFVNEEPPFFWTEDMGSYRYARLCRDRGEDVSAMICLEMLGFYSNRPGSQDYFFPLNFFFPPTGNFVAFVSNLASRGLLRQAAGAFRRQSAMPAEAVALPWFLPGVFWSDHWPFWEFGYQALMVTDTAFFRNPHYHEPTDLPATLDYGRMACVVAGLELMVAELADSGTI